MLSTYHRFRRAKSLIQLGREIFSSAAGLQPSWLSRILSGLEPWPQPLPLFRYEALAPRSSDLLEENCSDGPLGLTRTRDQSRASRSAQSRPHSNFPLRSTHNCLFLPFSWAQLGPLLQSRF